MTVSSTELFGFELRSLSLSARAAAVCSVEMFAQGQLLGMQSDLLMRLKTEINAWDKVASRHPYSVYRQNELPAFTEMRQSDPFTTSFGGGLPFRTYDRNRRARNAETACRTMEQPYPTGYTGHVGTIRHVVGQTYGQQVREAINSVTPSVELATVSPKEAIVSTQQLAYLPPDKAAEAIHTRVANARSIRVPVDHESRFASSSQLSYKPPPPRSYATPGWSERPTSNIGQPDVYKHAKKLVVHEPKLPTRFSNGSMHGAPPKSSSSSQGTITRYSETPEM